jgi:hypothetical protein
MRAELEDWKNGWFGLRLAASAEEIAHLISLLQNLLKEPEQHFHVSSDYKAPAGLGDMEISVKHPEDVDNLFLSGLALAPGVCIRAA